MSEIKVNSIKGVGASAAAITVNNSDGTCTLASGSKLNNCTTDGTTNLTIADGNLVVGTAGHGMDFSAQTATSVTGATTSDELLDHYEEGSWTPVFQNNDNGGTFPVSTYIRVGRLVSISFHATVGGGNDTSGFKITGLPFNPDKNGVAPVATNCNIACFARVYDSQDKMEVHKFDDTDITYQNLSDKFIFINATYRCNP